MSAKAARREVEVREWTYGQLFLQAVVEVFGLVGLQLLEGNPRLANELVVPEFVLVTHRDPGGRGGNVGEEEEEEWL